MPRRLPGAEQSQIIDDATALVAKVRSSLQTLAVVSGQRALEEKTGRGRGYLSHLFAGTIKNLSLQQVFELLLALDMPIASFFARVLGEEKPPPGGMSRDELFELVDAYMERRSGEAAKPRASKKPKKPVKNGKK